MVQVPKMQQAMYSVPVLFALFACFPAIAAGANSPPSEREIREASPIAVSKNVQIRRNASSEAAATTVREPVQNRRPGNQVQNAAQSTHRTKEQTIIPAPRTSAPQTNLQNSKTTISNAAAIATEAEMAMALNMPLEPKSAQDARFATSDMRPQDVAPWQKIGSPYQVNGVWYIPAHEPNYDETGEASWYGNQFNGRPTANGEVFDMNLVTVAHPTLPIPSLVEVINLENGRSIVARVNDRGPFAHNRLVDVSQRGAELLGFKEKGRARVRVRYVGQAPQLPLNASATKPVIQAAATSQAPAPQVVIPSIKRAVENKTTSLPSAPITTAQSTVSGEAFVQIGAFSSLLNAQRLLDQNSNLGPGKIIPIQNETGSIYRVVIGPFDATEAALKAQEVKSGGINGARVIANNS